MFSWNAINLVLIFVLPLLNLLSAKQFSEQFSEKESPNDSVKDLWKSSSCHTNIQYDVYKSTKKVLKDFLSNQEDKLQHHLTA